MIFSLSLFNIVPYNRNALGPAFLQNPDSMVEEFMFLVLVLQPSLVVQIRSSSSANFRPFMNSFSFGNRCIVLVEQHSVT